MTITTQCPPKSKLNSLSLGLLSDDESGDLLRHLDDCNTCQLEIQSIDSKDDTLLKQIKGSAQSESTVDYESESECQRAGVKALAAIGAGLTDSASSQFDMPEQIGDYEIVSKLGRGGMGQVFLGRHTKLGRSVAIKCIAKHRLFDDSANDRFAAEMKFVGGLTHPNIVQAFDARESDGMAVLVTELIDGLNVKEVVKRLGALEVGDACQVALAICKALDYVHAQGMIHRDVKPSNIMIDINGHVKLLDLGLARQQSSDGGQELTATGQAIGTVDYVAPEQIVGGRDVDHRSDIYGLGCTLYKMLTGNAPFETSDYPTTLTKLNAHANDLPRPVGDIIELPVKLKKLLHRMLQKSPTERPQTFEEIQTVLSTFAAKSDLKKLVTLAIESEGETQQQPATSPRRTKTKPSRRWPWMTAIAAGLVGIVFGCLMGITLTVKKPNGESANITVPNGASAEIDSDGNITVTLADGSSQVIDKAKVKSGEIITVPDDATTAVDSDGNVTISHGEQQVELPTVDPALKDALAGDLVDLFQEPSWSKETGLIRRSLIAGKKPIIAIRPTDKKGEGSIVTIALNDSERESLKSAKERKLDTRLISYDETNHWMDELAKLEGAYRVKSLLSGKSNLPTNGALIIIRGEEMVLWRSPNDVQKNILSLRSDLQNQFLWYPDVATEAGSLVKEFTVAYQFDSKNKLRLAMKLGRHHEQLDFETVSQEMEVRLERIKEPKGSSEELAVRYLNRGSKSIEADFKPQISIHVAVPKGEGAIPAGWENAEISLKTIQQDGEMGSYKKEVWVNQQPFVTNESIAEAKMSTFSGGCIQLKLTPKGGERFWAEINGLKGKFFVVSKVNNTIVSAFQSAVNESTVHAGESFCHFGGGAETTQLQKWVNQINESKRVELSPEEIPDNGNQKLKSLSLSFLLYASDHGTFPASKNVTQKADKDSKPFSWRVAILPSLGLDELYSQYRFNEDWDSEHNSKLLSKMPDVYRHPSAAKDSTTTWYVGFADAQSALGVEQGFDFGSFKDGTANTLLLVETDSGIPWTKPEDLPFTGDAIDSVADPAKSPSKKGVWVSRADGSVHLLPFQEAKENLRKLITKAGGEVLEK